MASFVDGNNTSSRSLHGQTQVLVARIPKLCKTCIVFKYYIVKCVTIELALSQFSGGNFNTLKDLLPESHFLV